MTRRTLATPTALLLLGLAVTACSPVVATRGNMVEPERVKEIVQGTSRAEDVAAILGTPTHVGTFDNTRWYYIGQKTEKTAFFQPEVIERRILVVQFDPQGVVQEVKQMDAAAGQEVEIVDRTTPTSGRELTFMEQLLGNVGRFGSKTGGDPTKTTTRSPI